MRIHSDTLTSRDVYNAADTATREGGSLAGRTVRPTRFDLHKSRTRARAYDVALTGNNPRRQQADRDIYAATFDEWGWFLAHLFAVDPDAVAGPYNGAAAFHTQTRHAYVLPTDGGTSEGGVLTFTPGTVWMDAKTGEFGRYADV